MTETSPGLLKPCYLFKPSNIIRRLQFQFSPPKSKKAEVTFPWGTQIEVDLDDCIGREIFNQRVFDIAVSECAWRLLQRGDQVLDVGANIGYMTNLFSSKVGANGIVHSFEPHPTIRQKLEANVKRLAQTPGTAPVTIHPCAVGNVRGTAELAETGHFGLNQGTAHLVSSTEEPVTTPRYQVHIEVLDEIFPAASFTLLKIDVEGHEASVLKGANRLLQERRIRHVIYEDHEQGRSGLPELLAGYGYTVYSIGHTLFGLELRPPGEPVALDTSWESVNYLATTDAPYIQRVMGKGWKVLKG